MPCSGCRGKSRTLAYRVYDSKGRLVATVKSEQAALRQSQRDGGYYREHWS